ncbi:MAG: methyltransferase [Candidatus Sericytochromatia bacterium]|nr:MAG: methyltransferase [Candidatus Sericytochromatia bacterium]
MELEKFINKIINGDCLEVLKAIPDCSIDAVITSPPYNMGRDYDVYNDNRDFDEYFNWLFQVLDELVRVLNQNRRLIINIQPVISKKIPTHHIISNYLLKKGLQFYTEIIWYKNNYKCVPFLGSQKHKSPYIKSNIEYILVFTKGDDKYIKDIDILEMSEFEYAKITTTFWNINPDTEMKKLKHPAKFPLEIPERLIKLFTYPDDIILDPFIGTGTTALACLKLKRRFIGIELSRNYCETANKLIENFIKQKSLF